MPQGVVWALQGTAMVGNEPALVLCAALAMAAAARKVGRGTGSRTGPSWEHPAPAQCNPPQRERGHKQKPPQQGIRDTSCQPPARATPWALGQECASLH